MKWVLFPNESGASADIGGKARALASAARAGLPVPDWFVVRGEACFQTPALSGLPDATLDPATVEALLANASPEKSVMEEIRQAIASLSLDQGAVAVRSSAIDEDGVEHSFAGQLDSFLWVKPDKVAEKIVAVWRSGFSSRILAYRKQNGLPPLPRPPAVLIQRMVAADAAGVAFSADPVSGRRSIAVVSAVPGLGSALVSGEADADTWRVDRSGRIVEHRTVVKHLAHRPAPGSDEGVRVEVIPETMANEPSMREDQVVAIAALARRCAAHFNRPQDIEWALEKDRIYLLQSRPITSIASRGDPDGALNIWDNSNIAESYGGITTPLTYSFARRIYEEVYRQFCRLMAVPNSRIAAHSSVFRCMIGLVRGRVYYSLLNWYRVLALLPGFTVNRRFMEQMMGVKESLPADLVSQMEGASRTERLKESLRFAASAAGLLIHHFTLRWRIRRFRERLDRALANPDPPLSEARPDELAAYYRDLERQLLTRWDAPLINDFFAMIFFGVLKKLAQDWCGDTDGTLQNNLLCGEGGIVSAEPARRVRDLARVVASRPGTAGRLASAPVDMAVAELRRYPDFAAAYDSYLEKFGDRCLDELKLESPTLHDDATPLVRAVLHLAVQLETKPEQGDRNLEGALRRKAEQQVAAALKGKWHRKFLFWWVLRNTRIRVRERENLRFERTRLFGRVRRILVAFGHNFHAMNRLDSPQDIFYLSLEEILGFCDGTSISTDLWGLAALRRAEFGLYAKLEPPADRFETRGPVYHGNSFFSPKPDPVLTPADGSWQGIGCCPGIVRGPVRVVSDPREAVLGPGEILVAERTDPGWIMLFAAAKGLLVERGSLLSHSAIVSREMGIPSIVSIPGIRSGLKTGDWVEMDGSTGRITKTTAPEGQEQH